MNDISIKAALLQGCTAASMFTASVMLAILGTDPVIPATTLAAVGTVVLSTAAANYYDFLVVCQDRAENYDIIVAESEARLHDTGAWITRHLYADTISQ